MNATDFCLRNRLRHHVLPRLTAENPNAARIWLDTSRQLRQEDAFLSDLARSAMAEIADGGGFSIRALRALHPVLQRRVLFGYLERFGVTQPQLKHLQLLEELMAAARPSALLDLPGCRIALLGGLITSENPYQQMVSEVLSRLGTVVTPQHNALWGAAQMAWEL